MSCFFQEGSYFRREDYFPPGTVVERELDGTWYLARVLDFEEQESWYTIQYADDGNEESFIDHSELRRPHDKDVQFPSAIEKPRVPKPPMCLPIQDLLAGDDAKYVEKTPRIIVHKAGMLPTGGAVDPAKIINAPDAMDVAVGVGVKGARCLRHEGDESIRNKAE